MHVIRLRSAWREQGGCWVRRFNKPTGLEGGDRVWLAWDGEFEGAELNGTLLHSGNNRHDVTELLEQRNVLELTGEESALYSTRLEIEPVRPV